MRCAEVGWEARSRRDHPAEAARPASSIVFSALARSSARPWSEANRSAANTPCRLIAASTVGQSTAASPTKASTPPTVQETRCGLRIDAPSSIVEPVAAGNDVSEGHAATSRAPAATSAGCPTWIDGTGEAYAGQHLGFSAANSSSVRSGRPASRPATPTSATPSSPRLSSAPPVNRSPGNEAGAAGAGRHDRHRLQPPERRRLRHRLRAPAELADRPDHRPEDRPSGIAAMPASSTISGVAGRQRM
jgi:hypothetical protein